MSDLQHESRTSDLHPARIPAQRVDGDRDRLGIRLALCGVLLLPDVRLGDAVRRLTEDGALCWHSPTGPASALEPSGGPRDGLVLQVGIQMRASGWPVWADCLGRLGVPLPAADANTEEPSVLVAVSTGGSGTSRRTVVWCFGQISRSIPSEVLDRRFGLVAALNKHVTSTPTASWRPLPSCLPQRRRPADPKNHVRGIESEILHGHPHRSSARAMGHSSLEGLRFDMTADQVRRVRLDTADPLIGPMEGGRALRFETYLRTLNDLIALTEHVLEMRERHDYRRDWEWIDHSTPVTGRKGDRRSAQRALRAHQERG